MRRIDNDCTLTYIIVKEAWYASSCADEPPSILVAATADGDGSKWEFEVQERELGGKTCLRLKMFDDAFEAFYDIPEFFLRLRGYQPRTLRELRMLLDHIGAVDATKRARPSRVAR
jgi:hypothetical protein